MKITASTAVGARLAVPPAGQRAFKSRIVEDQGILEILHLQYLKYLLFERDEILRGVQKNI